LITPDLGIYGFPHFRFFETFLSHGLMISAVMYMTIVEGVRPTWGSMGGVVGWTDVYLGFIFFFNRDLGSDYLLVNTKPVSTSILDFLPGWPWYVLDMELIGVGTFILLYVPVLIEQRRRDFRF